MSKLSELVDRNVTRALLEEAFERIDDNWCGYPSEVEKYLEDKWGFGGMWREWWLESGEEYK